MKTSRIYGCSTMRLSNDDKKYYFDHAFSIQQKAIINGERLPWKIIAKRLGLRASTLYNILKNHDKNKDKALFRS
jgi:hypothetical protein